MSQVIEYPHIYKYRRFGNWPGLQPIIPVELRYRDKEIWTEALLDTGATFPCFDPKIASDWLGIDLSKLPKEQIVGINGIAIAHKQRLGIRFGPLIGFITCYVLFYEGLDNRYAPNLVGRLGTFDHLQIGFDEAQGSIYMALNP